MSNTSGNSETKIRHSHLRRANVALLLFVGAGGGFLLWMEGYLPLLRWYFIAYTGLPAACVTIPNVANSLLLQSPAVTIRAGVTNGAGASACSLLGDDFSATVPVGIPLGTKLLLQGAVLDPTLGAFLTAGIEITII